MRLQRCGLGQSELIQTRLFLPRTRGWQGREGGEAPTRPTNLQTGACSRDMEGRQAGEMVGKKKKT